jgi:antitoxin VapB
MTRKSLVSGYAKRPRFAPFGLAFRAQIYLEPGFIPAHAVAYATGLTMNAERHVKLFRNGRNQAVRIPREFELPGEDAIIRKEGQKLIIEACPPKSLLAVLASLSPLNEDFPPIADAIPRPVDL